MSMFTLADPTSDREEVSRAPRSAAPCRCAGGDEIAYRDDDGDWTCIRCGRQFCGQATARLALASSMASV